MSVLLCIVECGMPRRASCPQLEAPALRSRRFRLDLGLGELQEVGVEPVLVRIGKTMWRPRIDDERRMPATSSSNLAIGGSP
jgi:hypothetical protein